MSVALSINVSLENIAAIRNTADLEQAINNLSTTSEAGRVVAETGRMLIYSVKALPYDLVSKTSIGGSPLSGSAPIFTPTSASDFTKIPEEPKEISVVLKDLMGKELSLTVLPTDTFYKLADAYEDQNNVCHSDVYFKVNDEEIRGFEMLSTLDDFGVCDQSVIKVLPRAGDDTSTEFNKWNMVPTEPTLISVTLRDHVMNTETFIVKADSTVLQLVYEYSHRTGISIHTFQFKFHGITINHERRYHTLRQLTVRDGSEIQVIMKPADDDLNSIHAATDAMGRTSIDSSRKITVLMVDNTHRQMYFHIDAAHGTFDSLANEYSCRTGAPVGSFLLTFRGLNFEYGCRNCLTYHGVCDGSMIEVVPKNANKVDIDFGWCDPDQSTERAIVITVGDLMNKEHEICVPDSTTFYEFGRRYADLVGYSKCKLYYKYDGMTINFDSRLKLKELGITDGSVVEAFPEPIKSSDETWKSHCGGPRALSPSYGDFTDASWGV